MIAQRNKRLFAAVVMALTLARAAPLPTEPVDIIIETVPTDEVVEGLHHHRLPQSLRPHHHSNHHHNHQISPEEVSTHDGEDYVDERRVQSPGRQAHHFRTFTNSTPRHRSGAELAEHVLDLRDYIDTLDEDEFEAFMDHYLDVGDREEMFALDLALGLDDDEKAVKEIDYPFPSSKGQGHARSSYDNYDYDDDEIHFVPLKKQLQQTPQPQHQQPQYIRGHHQMTSIRTATYQYQPLRRNCSLEDYEDGLCVPAHHRTQAPSQSHHRYPYNTDDTGDYYDSEEEGYDSDDYDFSDGGKDASHCAEKEMKQGLCHPSNSYKQAYANDLDTLLQGLTSLQGSDGFYGSENRTEIPRASHFGNQDILSSPNMLQKP